MIELTEKDLREINGGAIIETALIKKGLTIMAGTALGETTRRVVSDAYDAAKNWLFNDNCDHCEE